MLDKLFRRKFTPLNLITISKSRLTENYETLNRVNPEIRVAPVLKSNGYGHGIQLVGKILDTVGAPFLCVDSLYEAFQLHTKIGVKTPILIMGYIHPESLKVKQLPFSFALYDFDHAKALSKSQKRVRAHIFVDTGMHREGVGVEELKEFLRKLKTLGNIEVEGLMSHLAEPSKPDSELTRMQLANFKKARAWVLESGYSPEWFHLGGTYGLLNNLTAGCNLVRVGRAVYGIDESDTKTLNLKLKPVLKHTTTLVQIKKIKKGDKVGYSGTYAAKKDMTIGILPLGYNDGVDRRLSGKGIVSVESVVNGKSETVFCPIIGLVSMNVTTIDISAVKDPVSGQVVVVFSDNPLDKNSVVNSCRAGEILPHEMLIHIAESTKRELVD